MSVAEMPLALRFEGEVVCGLLLGVTRFGAVFVVRSSKR
jgi:hypothetical protein